jgi:two-component system nitrogen regulation response regulator NtrX
MSKEIIDVLVIDDERDIGELTKDILEEDLGLHTHYVLTAKEALKFLQENNPRLIILDVWLEGSDEGLSLLKVFQESYKHIPVIVISGHGNIDTAVKAIKMGAYNYLEKPFKAETIKLMVERTIQNLQLKQQHYQTQQQLDLSSLVGSSKKIIAIRNSIQENSQKNKLVLLQGSLGTGKRKIAKIIHNYSNLSEKPFYTLTDSENDDFLIIHQAQTPSKYKGATIFIPDIAKLSAVLQKNLLQRINQLRDLDNSLSQYRIICGTSENLEQSVANGKFNADLYQRLLAWQIYIPDLKDRKQDIEPLVEHFAAAFSLEFGTPKLSFSQEKLTSLLAYDWPGNILELKSKISDILLTSLLKGKKKTDNKSNQEKNQYFESFAKQDLRKAKNIFEKEYIKMQLHRFEGNISKTADFIGMSRPALHKKMNDLNIEQQK